jgi:hypothetical protein
MVLENIFKYVWSRVKRSEMKMKIYNSVPRKRADAGLIGHEFDKIVRMLCDFH